MKINIFILFIVLILNVESLVQASLKMTQYQPLIFQINFSQSINLPAFQILVDNNNLEYLVLNDSTQGTTFNIQIVSDYKTIDTQNTQSFSLLFNFPINIQNGNLYLNNYVLYPEKAPLIIKISEWPVYFVFTALFICSYFGIVGLAFIDFIQIYILTQLKYKNQASSIYTFSSLFLIDTVNNNDSALYLMRLAIPTLVVVLSYIFGRLIKKISYHIQNHFFKKRVTKFFAYNFFLTIWTIAIPSSIYKALQFIIDKRNNNISLKSGLQIIAIFLTYLNFINLIAYLYVLYFVLNPKICQQKSQFRKYMITSQFQLYNKFHRGLHLRSWVKRNLFLFIFVRKFIIIILFFQVSNITPYVLALQLAFLFYIFTIRPYKDQFYTQISIICNLIYFFFYLLSIEGLLYFDISPILESQYSLSQFLLAKTIIFYIICFIGIILSIAQGLRLLKNLKYQFRKDQVDKKEINPIVKTRGRLYTETSEKMMANMQQSLIFDSPNSPQIKRLKRQASQTSNRLPKVSLFQIQMQQFSSPVRKRAQSKQIKKKWKDKSLLEQLATNGY